MALCELLCGSAVQLSWAQNAALSYCKWKLRNQVKSVWKDGRCIDFGEAHKFSVVYVQISCTECTQIEQEMWEVKVKGKGKGHPRTGHEGPEVEYNYRSTLSLTSALDGVGG